MPRAGRRAGNKSDGRVKSKPFIIGFLAVMAAIVGASVYLSQTVKPAEKAIVAAASPDGRYKAVRERLTRAGDPTFCADSIAVFLSVYPDSFVESDKVYEVYAAPCATSSGRTPPPEVQWLSNTALRITYSRPPAAEAAKLKMKPMDASEYVHVTYVAR
jgi:hypothetical protein